MKNVNLALSRILAVALVGAMLLTVSLFFAACVKTGAEEGEGGSAKSAAGKTLSEIIDDSGFEYGEPAVITDNSAPLYAYIRYPETGIKNVDAAISEWAESLCAEGAAELDTAAGAAGDKAEGEVNIQSRDFFVDERYIGIESDGVFANNMTANPQSIVNTFNVDVQKGELLKNEDIIDPSKVDKAVSLLRAEIAGRYPDMKKDTELKNLGADSLAHIALAHDGLDVLIARHTLLPGYIGSQVFTLPYDKLGDALLVGAEGKDGELPQRSGQDAGAGIAQGSQGMDGAAGTGGAVGAGDAAGAGGAAGEEATRRDIDPNQPMLALTFDDGPSKYTADILDLLEENDARATFCVLGNLVDTRPEAMRRATELGCEVFGHSWDHKQLTKLTPEEVKAELTDTSDAIEKASGQNIRFYRPPYGATDEMVESVSRELGYSMINWSADTLDWKTRDADAVYKAVMRDAGEGQIILMHDIHGTTAQAMKRAIPALVEKGYQLVTVSELLKYSGIEPEPGKTYYNASSPSKDASE
ncbi:MAG: polysaccharide deacetylase family protein [Clostridiales Family XIII bacterium]|nr:polysaccharide deacetylase family protein [Clostridiales Family XIII bacterium]